VQESLQLRRKGREPVCRGEQHGAEHQAVDQRVGPPRGPHQGPQQGEQEQLVIAVDRIEEGRRESVGGQGAQADAGEQRQPDHADRLAPDGGLEHRLGGRQHRISNRHSAKPTPAVENSAKKPRQVRAPDSVAW
jgi:hypothetical protein